MDGTGLVQSAIFKRHAMGKEAHQTQQRHRIGTNGEVSVVQPSLGALLWGFGIATEY